MTQVFSTLRSGVALLALLTVLLGGVYPLVVFAVGQVAFHHKANGSLIETICKDSLCHVIGSELLGQQFDAPQYFWGRLSATTPAYNASASSGSNLSPANPKLLAAANVRMESLQKADGLNKEKIPVDLITASASGLDPHISLAAANYQIIRVAKARGKKTEEIAALVATHTQNGLGAKRVNVLLLNMALDRD